MFVNVFNFASPQINCCTFIDTYSLFFQQTVVYFSFILLVLFFITLFLVKLEISTTKFNVVFNCIKFLNITVSVLILVLVSLKFTLYLWSYKTYGFYLSSQEWAAVSFNYLPGNIVFDLNTSILSDVIILLGFSSATVCIFLLGEKSVAKKISNISIFSSFLMATIFMVYTTNMLIMFIGFEFLFLPTLYFVYHHGYVKRADKTLRVLLYWTLLGAFLVFSAMGYMYSKYKTLNFYILAYSDFSFYESIFLYIFIFFGFGVKVPVFPFHYWLTKIHVEAPAGFSIFLSGFLVKAAIYCFYYFNLIFQFELFTWITSVVAIIGAVEASIKMWTQTDFKKLIAFATIQEMNLILFLLLNYQNILDYSLFLFILIHGWLSTLMFFLVDIIQKKTSSRNIVTISGMAYNFPELKLIIWFIILIFSGFPLTVKFLIEWQIFGNLILQTKELYISIFLMIIVVGVVGFAKQMIIVLYGMPRHTITTNYTLSKRDKYLFYLIIFVLVCLNIVNYFLG